MKKNYILAFALSFAVLMSWQYFVGKSQGVREPSGGPPLAARPAPVEARAVDTPSSPLPIRRDSVVVFEIGNNRVSVNRYGGGVAQWEIKEGTHWLTLCPEKSFSAQSLATFPDVAYDIRQVNDRLILTCLLYTSRCV